MKQRPAWLPWPLGGRGQLLPLATVGLATAAIAARLVVGPNLIDDAYITFRYAKNLAAGIGLVFNPGERIMGSSSPLYAALLGVFGRMGVEIPAAAYVLGICAAAITVILILRLGEALNARAAGILAAVALALAPKAVLPSVSGMETAVFTLWVCGAFYCAVTDKHVAAAALAGAATVTRPEGILVVIALLCAMALDRRRPQAAELVLMVLPICLWILFATAYFGTPLPHSVTAKWTLYPRYADPFYDAKQVFRYLTEPFTWIATGSEILPAHLFFGTAITLGAIFVSRRKAAASALWLWCLMMAGGFAIGNRYIFPWYLAPMVPIFLLLAAIGILTPLLGLLRGRRFGRSYSRWLAFVCLLLAAVLIMGLGAELMLTARGSSLDIASRENEYASAATWIQRTLGSEQAIAAVEIGALGFTYPGPIIDLSGLVTPWALAYYTEEPYVFRFPHDIPPRLIEEKLPSVLVVFDGFLESARGSGILSSEYCQAYTSPLTHHAFGTLVVLIRPLAFPSSEQLCSDAAG